MSSPHPFGFTFNHEHAGKLLQDAKEIASVSAIALLLSIIAVTFAVISVLTKSGIWGFI